MIMAREVRKEHWTAKTAFTPQRRREGLVVETVHEEVLLYDPASGHTYHLNQSALEVWQQCDGRRTTVDMALRQAASYDVDYETALDHVEQLVALFADSGLLDLEGD